MPSTFFGLNTAYTGLLAANAALNTTANNVSNVNTEGYSRQQVVQQASDAIRTFTTYGCAGAGVDTIAIERIRDEFYDVRFWENNSDLGNVNSKQYYYNLIEKYFTDDKTIKGFNSIFNEMQAALEEVVKDSGSATTKSNFIGYAKNLVQYFKDMSENLQNAQKDANSEIKVQTDAINSYAEQIATLNKQINVVEMAGGTANELRDKRTTLLDELSQIVKVDTVEVPIYDANDPTRETGGHNFRVIIAGGDELVNGNNYYTLSCIARAVDEKTYQSDADGLFDLYWSNGNKFSLTNPDIGGKLSGLLEIRDGNNGEYFHGNVTGTGVTSVDGVSRDTLIVEVSESYLKDLSKCTLSDTGGRINIGNQTFKYDSWSLDYDVDSDTYKYVFVMSQDNEKAVGSDRINKEASIGTHVQFQGIPYYQEQLNEFLRNYARAFNDILTQKGSVDDYGNDATFFFVADKPTDPSQFYFGQSYTDMADTNGDGILEKVSYSIKSTDDSYYRLTAANFAVSDTIYNDPGLLATRTGASTGESAYDVAKQLVLLKDDKSSVNFRGCSAGEFLQCMLSDVALNANMINNQSTTYETISKTVENLRTSISGVDEDEEAVDLVKFQNAYNLAAKMIQVMTECYDRLILQTGV